MVNNVINISRLMRKYGATRINPHAIEELHNFIEIWFERATPDILAIAQAAKRETIYPEDIIHYFNFPINDLENLHEKEDIS